MHVVDLPLSPTGEAPVANGLFPILGEVDDTGNSEDRESPRIASSRRADAAASNSPQPSLPAPGLPIVESPTRKFWRVLEEPNDADLARTLEPASDDTSSRRLRAEEAFLAAMAGTVAVETHFETHFETDELSSELSSPPSDRQWGFSRVVGRLTGGNVVVIAAGLVTGPITARVLGVNGRGDLAAILAVLIVGPWVLDLGLSLWLGRERARGVGREELLGAALPVALACSLIAVAAAIPLAHAIGHGRPVVTTYLEVGLFGMPVLVVLQALSGLAIGESRWRLVIANMVVGSVVPAVAIVVLALVGRLTVATAAGAYLVGALASALLFLDVVRGMRRLVFDRRRLVTASRFGVRSWFSTISSTATARLDQVLMAGLVSARQLGLYAVAVTVSSLTNGLISAVVSALYPRVAEGESGIVARSFRITIGAVAVVGLLLAATSPWLVPLVFGHAFSDAVPMVLILLVASVPMAGALVLSSALSAANDPGAAMRAELASLAFTVPALVVFLGEYGGLLAATVSLIAYTIRLGIQLRSARRVFSTRYREFILPSRGDLVWLRAQVRR